MKMWLASLTLSGCLAISGGATANEIMDAWWGEIGNAVVRGGVRETQVRRIFRNMDTIDVYATGPGSWSHEFRIAADVYRRKAEALELTGTKAQIIEAYEQANALYNGARWPALFTPERERAYQQQIATFMKIVKHKGVPMEVVTIPFEGKQIIGHFYNRGTGPMPVILWSGGLDGWKMGGLDFKQTLMDEGFAVFAVDLPGTGQSQWPLAADSDRVYSAIVDYLKQRPDVAGDKISVYFGSFSGVYAIKLALVDPDVTAAVNHSGGIHLFYTREFSAIPPLTTSMGMRATATIHAAGWTGQSVPSILRNLAEFSLENQGLLKPTPDQAPLLSIYGTADVLMPIEDLKYMTDSGVKTEALVYEGDRHMAWEHADDHQPKMIAWLKKQLGM